MVALTKAYFKIAIKSKAYYVQPEDRELERKYSLQEADNRFMSAHNCYTIHSVPHDDADESVDDWLVGWLVYNVTTGDRKRKTPQ